MDTELIRKADLVIFALYPHIFKEWIEANQQYFKPGAILTDVIGVKGCIVDDVQKMLREDCEYIAAHPMAGGEKLGVQNSNEKIFYQANYIIVPTEKKYARGESCLQADWRNPRICKNFRAFPV